MILQFPAYISLTSIKIQFFFAAYQIIADRSSSLHLGGDFDAPRKIPIFFLPLATTLFLSSPRLVRYRIRPFSHFPPDDSSA